MQPGAPVPNAARVLAGRVRRSTRSNGALLLFLIWSGTNSLPGSPHRIHADCGSLPPGVQGCDTATPLFSRGAKMRLNPGGL
ncbi:hypothetical protein EYF80_044538 [Liparis tanakae]|uniref:Uncharacterized protein n=1 Tax=Liparis tanakae TaxID=230148 RepID=A0A4Z2FVM3_9TELE|nr:hypothetical protein EYF80_044538 [Liparis tanakae]